MNKAENITRVEPINIKQEKKLPVPNVKRTGSRLPLIWIVPLLAIVFAAYLLREHLASYGPTITLKFADASGLKVGQTPLKYRGVRIGDVKSITLSSDEQFADVGVRLYASSGSIAREGARFWIVRPEFGDGDILGLGTFLSGPYIDSLPGTGDVSSEFTGLDRQPVVMSQKGLRIIVGTSHLGNLRPNSPVYYRGIQVGVVESAQLADDSTEVEINVFIRRRYQRLVTTESKFWNVSGANVEGGLFSGVQLKVESLRSFVSGGMAFATPPDLKTRPAKNGTHFSLRDEAKEEWLTWKPIIAIDPVKDARSEDRKIIVKQSKNLLDAAVPQKSS